jgi:ribonucleoside-diphosphate reductase alpha chain
MSPVNRVGSNQPAIADGTGQALCRDVLLDKYARAGERTVREVRQRVAAGLAACESADARELWRERFLWALDNGFLPGGRICATVGTGGPETLINCFVQPIGERARGRDAAGRPSVGIALREATRTLRLGGGVGYDFSPLAPAGSRPEPACRAAIGPVAWMHAFDACGERLSAAGGRRGAQMAVLRVDHPDVEAFVEAKRSGGLRSFNLSVALSDAFMHALQHDASVDLVHREPPPAAPAARRDAQGRWIHRSLRARALWTRIMRAAYEGAEPGVLFIDRINRDNNLSYCEALAATNPCGEQPLPPYGACDLGSLNLVAFVCRPFTRRASIDWARYRQVVAVAVRALDNVLDLSGWPLPAQAAQAQATRRIGLGFTGLGDALMMLGLRYDRDEGRAMAARLARALRDTAARASVALARERGAFPLLDVAAYLAAPHAAARLPRSIRAAIRRDGIRNSHLTCIAPAGSISIAFADNVSPGIEPAWALRGLRHRRLPDGSWQTYAVEDCAWRRYRQAGGDVDALPESFLVARQIDALDHLRMVAAVQPCIDAGISKTINLPADYPWDAFRSLYLEAWRAGLKGVTTWRPGTAPGAVLDDAPLLCSAVDRPRAA